MNRSSKTWATGTQHPQETGPALKLQQEGTGSDHRWPAIRRWDPRSRRFGRQIWTVSSSNSTVSSKASKTDTSLYKWQSNHRCECQLTKIKFACFLRRILGKEIGLRLVQRSCDWQHETDDEPKSTALEIYSDWRRGQTTTFHNGYDRQFWHRHWHSGEPIRQQTFDFAITFARNLQAAFVVNRKLQRSTNSHGNHRGTLTPFAEPWLTSGSTG